MALISKVMCTNQREHQDPHERITHIGGVNTDGTHWKLAESAAIVGTENGRYRFYVNLGGKRVLVTVAMHQGRKYLKTTADGDAPNNLLNLPGCP